MTAPPAPVVGSRVRLQGLKKSPAFNGHEGRVIGVASDTGRALVELETFNGRILRVKPACAPLAPTPTSRAPVANGIMRRSDGEAFSAILNQGRYITNVINGFEVVSEAREPDDIHRLRSSGRLDKLLWLSARMYGSWVRSHGQHPKGVMGSLRETCEVSVKAFRDSAGSAKAKLPEGLSDFRRAIVAEADVPRWGEQSAGRSGMFWVVKDTPEGALMVAEREEHY